MGSLGPIASGNNKNYVQCRYFSRNIPSLIANLEIKINGRSIQNITRYNYIYNLLNDNLCGTDATNKKRVEKNANPLINLPGLKVLIFPVVISRSVYIMVTLYWLMTILQI